MIATSLLRYLERYRLPYRKHSHLTCMDGGRPTDEYSPPAEQMLQCALFSDGAKTFQFITFVNKVVTTSALELVVGKALTKLSTKQTNKIFFDCEPGAVPPLGERYGMQCLIDREVKQAERVFFSSGCLSTMVELSQCAFKALFEFPLYVSEPGAVSTAIGLLTQNAGTKFDPASQQSNASQELVQVIGSGSFSNYSVPGLSPLAEQLIAFVRRGELCNAELNCIVKQAPELEERLIQYANSPFHQYPKQIETSEQAINDVLGPELASYLLLAMTCAASLTVPLSGSLGGQAFWRHSFLTAVLSQSIARCLPKSDCVLPSVCYMAGLFHNLGLMLIAHLFPPEYKLLERLRSRAPKQALNVIEKKVLGLGGAQEMIAKGHSKLGATLLNYWGFPEVVQYVAVHHHNDCYSGDFEKYVHLIRLSNVLLAKEGVGDESPESDMTFCLNVLGLDQGTVERIYKQVIGSMEKIEAMSLSVVQGA